MTKPYTAPKSATVAGRIMRGLLNDTGNAAMLFGMAALPMLMAAGVAIDMGRANFEQTSFQSAVDAAALAVTASPKSSTIGLNAAQIDAREIELETIATQYLEKHYDNQSLTANITDVDVQVNGEQVVLTAKADVDTILMRQIPPIMNLVGVEKFSFNTAATVKKSMRAIELVMVMDTTGSMKDDAKLAGAKEAGKALLDKLYDGTLSAKPTSEYIRVALVPFSGAVRLNPSAHDFNINWIDTAGVNPYSKLNFNAISTTPVAWNNYYAWSQVRRNTTTSHTWNGCVEARRNGTTVATEYNTNDAAPSSGSPDTLFPAYFNPDAPGAQDSVTTGGGTYGISYRGGTSLTAIGSECRGLTATACSATTTTGLYVRQENYQKYIDTNVGTEPTSPSTIYNNYHGPWGGCAVSSVVPMTHDRAKVVAGLDAMVAHGITLIPEGLAWGWRAISPTEPLTKVEGYSGPGGSIPNGTIAQYESDISGTELPWKKIIVLMTDGDNNVSTGYSLNTSRYSAYGYGAETGTNNRFGTTSSSLLDDRLDTYTAALCTKVKNEDVEVYVASFGSDINPATKDMLRACATVPANYTHASTSADLALFYNGVGEKVKNFSVYVSN